MLGTVRKRDDDRLDYDVDFSKWLSSGDSITEATAVATPDGLTLDPATFSGTTVKVWLAGGTTGASYDVDVTVTTAQGRVKEVTFNLRITEC
ncbi:hypothetical protein D3C81_2125160 [compost metagenome]